MRLAQFFPQSWFFYLADKSRKAAGSSNMLRSFYETIWWQLLEDIINFRENSCNADVRTKQTR
jgi:hypothetical protein